ncbi:MAG: ABC transporter permease subunit [Spirochaetales bacterium]|nr:MAG: ABC transporter permease subunit [Spirochaetales bacterium]
MDNPFLQAVRLIVSGDREIYLIVLTSLRLSLTSTAITGVVTVPLGILLRFAAFPLKRAVVAVLNALMALPTVVVGLFVYSLLSRSGPLGSLNLLFTPAAIVAGQVVLSLPIILSLVYSGLSKLDDRFQETLVTLGAKKGNMVRAAIVEGRFVIISALLAGFGRVLGEVGISMMLGGNIRFYTRTMTTTIALETSKGEFESGLALGFILMILALVINGILHYAVRHDR